METSNRADLRRPGDQRLRAAALSGVSLSHSKGAFQRRGAVNNGEFPAARGGRVISAGLIAPPNLCNVSLGPACRDGAQRAMKRP